MSEQLVIHCMYGGPVVDRFERHQVTESWPEQANETIPSVGMVGYNLNLHCKF